MILKTMSGDKQYRISPADQMLANGIVPPLNYGASAAGVAVDEATVNTIAAVGAAIRLASSQVAVLGFGIYRGDSYNRQVVNTTWQSRFFKSVPNTTDNWYGLWEMTEACLTGSNNAYWWKVKDADTNQVVSVQVLEPNSVRVSFSPKGEKHFTLYDPRTRQNITVGTDQILHFRGNGGPGYPAAPSPVALYHETLGVALAKTSYESGFYARGMGTSVAVTYPRDVTPEQAERYQKAMQSTHGGVANQHKAKVLGGGATVTNIGVSMVDAQFIQSQKFSLEEIARIYSVPASMIGAGEKAGDGPLTPEHETARWIKLGLEPRLIRIEQTIYADVDFFGPNSRDYPRFDSQAALRGDLATEDLISHTQIQDGRLLVDEWRASKGLDPLPNGAGSIPVINPAGAGATPEQFLPNPVNPQTGDTTNA